MPRASSAMAVGWSPAASKSVRRTKRRPPSSFSRVGFFGPNSTGIASAELLCMMRSRGLDRAGAGLHMWFLFRS
jgi:hypothetical protein